MKLTSSSERSIYGINPIKEALRAKKRFLNLFIQSGREKGFDDILKIAKALNIKIEVLDKTFFDNHFPKGHQGIAGKIVDSRDASLEYIIDEIRVNKELPFFIILDGIEDPRNLGAIIRTADAVAANAVIHQCNRSARLTGVASKASAGATEYVRLIESANIKNIIKKLKSYNICIVGADKESNKTIWDIDFDVPIALLFGGEDTGIRPTVKALCDEIVKIPMLGHIQSLNVSAAMAVISFEVLRQRINKTSKEQ